MLVRGPWNIPFVIIDFSLVINSRVVNKSQSSFERYRAEQFPRRPRKFVRPKNGDLHYIYLSFAAGIAEMLLNLHSIPVSNHRGAEPDGKKTTMKEEQVLARIAVRRVALNSESQFFLLLVCARVVCPPRCCYARKTLLLVYVRFAIQN